MACPIRCTRSCSLSYQQKLSASACVALQPPVPTLKSHFLLAQHATADVSHPARSPAL